MAAVVFCAPQKTHYTVIAGRLVVENGVVRTVEMGPVVEAHNRFSLDHAVTSLWLWESGSHRSRFGGGRRRRECLGRILRDHVRQLRRRRELQGLPRAVDQIADHRGLLILGRRDRLRALANR